MLLYLWLRIQNKRNRSVKYDTRAEGNVMCNVDVTFQKKWPMLDKRRKQARLARTWNEFAHGKSFLVKIGAKEYNTKHKDSLQESIRYIVMKFSWNRDAEIMLTQNVKIARHGRVPIKSILAPDIPAQTCL